MYKKSMHGIMQSPILN